MFLFGGCKRQRFPIFWAHELFQPSISREHARARSAVARAYNSVLAVQQALQLLNTLSLKRSDTLHMNESDLLWDRDGFMTDEQC